VKPPGFYLGHGIEYFNHQLIIHTM